ncbi:MAG: PKD domain-containing protein, partial [Verrucomicrobia bacterium]|nr:PKD domain-containing protein [Verrucomicrobiota bacterium]
MITFLLLVVCVLTAVPPAPAQTLRFYTDRYRVFEGDAVRFIYFETNNTVAKANIKSWAWDFNGDGTFDAQGTNVLQMDQTWYATQNPLRVTNNIEVIAPILRVSNTLGQVFTVTNLTEDFRLGNQQEPLFLRVVKQATGNSKIKINFSANPRLVETNSPVRFYADVEAANDVLVNSITWIFGDGGNGAGSNPQHSYAVTGKRDVVMTVNYTITSGTTPTNQFISRTNFAFIEVVATPAKLSQGRAYRRGFPQEYDWDDIVKAYSATAANGDDYTYYHHFENAFSGAVNSPDTSVPYAWDNKFHEVVNEILQGQTLIGNKRLIEALRIKYPRLPDPDNPPPRLPIPPGVREQTAAIDVALLDYHAALLHVFTLVQRFGPEVLRAGAAPGNEPFPDFPRYLTFTDPTLGQQPIPIKNEYWQLTSCLEKLALGTMAKANKLFRLSLQEPEAREEAKEECKRAGLQGYLGMMVLAAGQTPEQFASNEGNSLLAQVKNARDLFEGINAGLNPLNNDGSFIPNESFAAIYQDAQEAVADAREAEIAARNEDRTYDQYQAELAKELLNQRLSFITPLRNLTGLDPALYNNLQTVDDQTDFRNTVNTRVKALIAGYPNTSPAGLGEYGSQVIAVIDASQGINQSINRLKNLYKSIEISKWANSQIDLVNAAVAVQLAASAIAKGIAESVSSETGTKGGVPYTKVNFNPGSIKTGVLSAKDIAVQTIQQAAISDIQLEAEIRKSLLEVVNLKIDIERAKNRLDQEFLRLDQMLSQMDRLIEDLAATRQTAANLYFSDPSFRVVVSRAQRRADAEMDYAID